MDPSFDRNSVEQIARRALARLEGRGHLPGPECVDLLLDLHQATEDPYLRWVLTARLDDLRLVGEVRRDALRRDLEQVIDLAFLGRALHLDWCDELLVS